MASMLERTAECEIFFKDNWTQTPIYIEGDTPLLDTSNLQTYISLQYANVDNKQIGLGRNAGYGVYTILCYHNIKKLSVGLSDDVNNFFSCQDLPKDIHTTIGIQKETQTLENGLFVSPIEFDIRQDS